MTKVVRFSEAEVAEPADFENVGLYAREGDAFIVGGAVDYPHHWADFSISQTSAVELRINPGRLFAGDKVYAADDPIDVDLQVHLPLVTGDRRFVALLLRGASETVALSRMVETDADTEETVLQLVPKTDRRFVEVVIQQGLPSPTPVRPQVASDQCCLAFVELTPTGIAAVESDNTARLKSLYEVEGRLTLVEGDMADIRRRTTTLETDVANIASRLGDIPNPVIMRQIKRDVAQLRREMALPDEARAYWYDPGLVRDQWDTDHPAWLARIREGVRFAFAQERDAQLALLDPASPAIRLSGALLLPAWEEATRIDVESDGGSINISQIVHTVTTAVRREISRRVVEYGETVRACENAAEWSSMAGRSVGETFTKNGETFEVVSRTGFWAGHRLYAVRKIIMRDVTDVYWDYVTEEYGVNGAIYGQTWLNAQPMVATSVDLFFTRVGSAGDVHLFVCECNEGGVPRIDQVVVKSTLAVADLATGWVSFPFRPSLLDSGKRYAWFTVTTGNHALGTVTGNKFAQGSSYQVTDGAWAQGSATVDFAFRLNAARFTATRTVVEMDPLTLESGMTELRLLHGGWAPGGTELVWEVQPSGAPGWQALTQAAEGTSALAGLPALTRLRAVFVGTTDLQPAIVMDATARGMTFRPRGDMVAVSEAHDFGLTATTVQVEAVVDAFDTTKHAFANRLMVGGDVLTPASTSVSPDPLNPEKFTFLSTFTLAAPAAVVRARFHVATSEVTDVPFIQNSAIYAL